MLDARAHSQFDSVNGRVFVSVVEGGRCAAAPHVQKFQLVSTAALRRRGARTATQLHTSSFH